MDTLRRRLFGEPVVESWPFRFEWMWGVIRRSFVEDSGQPPQVIRRSQEAMMKLGAVRDVARIPTTLRGVDAEWFRADSSVEAEPEPGSKAIVYLHGGGYFFGSTDSYADLLAEFAHRSDLPVLGVNYRRCPEHRIEDAVDDVVAVFEELYGRGWRAENLVVAGDSAGGGLAVSSCMAMRDRGVPVPAALGLISPWVDMRCEANSLEENSETDYMTGEMLEEAVQINLRDRSPDDPMAS
ncbi:MAG: alpha/beta hydrolase fold domain-containing protein, partial [Bradymonadaceae bacterium]